MENNNKIVTRGIWCEIWTQLKHLGQHKMHTEFMAEYKKRDRLVEPGVDGNIRNVTREMCEIWTGLRPRRIGANGGLSLT
jgi:hypothetical protein